MASLPAQPQSLVSPALTEWVKRLATPIRVYVVSAILLSLLVGAASARIELTYLQNFPFFYDTVGYYLYNGRLEARLEEKNRFEVAWHEFLNNDRYPLRTTPVVLLAPQLLSHPMSHLVTALPMFATFLFMLAWTVYKRSGSMLYGLGAIVVFSAIRGMFDPTIGLAVYWLDLHAAFLVGAAGLCLINSNGGRDLRWLAAFALLAALAGLSRFVAAGYIFVLAGPVLAVYLLRRAVAERAVIVPVLVPLGLIGAILLIVDGYFLYAHAAANLAFYSFSGYNLSNTVEAAAKNVVNSYQFFVDSRWTIVLLIGVFVANLGLGLVLIRAKNPQAPGNWVSNFKQLFRGKNDVALSVAPSWNWVDTFAILWMAFSHLAFVILILQLVGDTRTALYALPFLFLLLVAPLPWHQNSLLTPLGNVLALALIVAGVGLGVYHYRSEYRDVWLPSAREQQMKKFYVTMGEEIAKQGEHLVAMTYFDTVQPMPVAESYFRFGKYSMFPTRHAGKTLFNDQFDEIWGVEYPNMTPAQVSQEIYAKLSRWVDIVMVFEDPNATNSRFRNEYTRTVSRTVAENVKTDPQWTKLFVVDSPMYGLVAGYRNSNQDTGGFESLLWRTTLSLP